MRWDNLRDSSDPGNGEQTGPAVPALFQRGTVTRTFDTPGFRGMTFFEVHARSIINRVPDASRVPFRWTINPYRGCSHSCTYCAEGETPILMADGRTRPLRELQMGDAIYGTIRRGAYRRYVITQVLAHWQTVKPAYLITLADGTHLVASADHRFLSDRGWKYVTGTEQGAARRPHLTMNNELMGVGAFAHAPKESLDYRRGYLCGMVRGDAHIGHYVRKTGHQNQFRLALVDCEALIRTKEYLAHLGVDVVDFTFSEATATRKRMLAIRCSSSGLVGFIEWLIQWPETPSLDWRKGFLAGMFDAEGCYSRGILRIGNTDPDMIKWTLSSLHALGFTTAVDRTSRTNGMAYVRVPGGLKQHLSFFHMTDPAITRKRSIEGTAIKSNADLRVTRIEPLGVEMPMYDITTGTGDFIANGVVSHNCFARNTHTYLDLDAGQDFNSKIVVKVNAPDLARRELARRRSGGEHIAMGTNVDCYQRAEGRYQLMPGILSALRDAANPFSILTKGTLILRDADLIEEAAGVTDVGLAVSVGSTGEDLWRAVEPGTPSPLRRLEVCAEFDRRGLGCGVLMGPVIPFLSDSPEQLAATVRLIAEAGADYVSPIVLHLRPGAREWFLAWLRERHPELVARYRALYGRGAYAPKAYQEQITAQVRELAGRYGIGRTRRGRRLRATPPQPPESPPRPAPVQLSLL
ncbi:MAG: intein-containing Rv2578c family radical SAM protein [Gemmatimonadota bacterium]